MKNIVCLKLVNGEELIATDKGNNLFEDVAMVAMMPSQTTGKVQMAVMPYLPYSEDPSFTIKPEFIMIRHNPSQDLINYYNRIYGAGIQVVSSL